ncbi:MAG TPA: adenylate/guanylate cyclase domain-containing protein [Candidatus Didemnitutus sp.]|nr:adenylate/guanylate cyclase domain-containing protein [Candidatus Didemnitutus sp.]
MSDDSRTFQLLRTDRAGGLSVEQQGQLQLAQSDVRGKQASILVVDDSEPLRSIMVLTLQHLGYAHVAEAGDGVAALELLFAREFDLVILDIEMPKLDGYGVLTALAKDPVRRHVPVIVTSGLDQTEAVVRCLELGAEDFLSKPVNSVILRARIGSSLERKRLRDLERLRLLELAQEKQALEIEKEKSERLLLNILPKSIAARLRHSERTIAERYSAVTVLFADLVDFTALTNRTDPEELVSLLNDLFSRFDQIADRLGLEKIKTIGDSYFVVGGLPERRSDHAESVADMALAMLQSVVELNLERRTSLSLRLGINSGPVVAGVIGRKKFTYDLWGATVNFASRLQSTSLEGRINVSDATYQLLKDKFNFTPRGTVISKGVGEVSTYLLDGRKPAVSASLPPI